MMLGYALGGLAEGQKVREDMELRRNADARAQAEAEQIKRMREYQLKDFETDEQIARAQAGIDEYMPVDPNTPDAPRARRAQQDIDFDRAEAIAKTGRRAKDFDTSNRLRMQAYELAERGFKDGLAKAYATGDVREIAKFVSNFSGVPGKMDVQDLEGGGYRVNTIGARGQPVGSFVIKDADELFKRASAGLNFDNWLKAKAEERAAAVEGRASQMFVPQLSAAQSGARSAAVTADVSEATKADAIRAGQLVDEKASAAIKKDEAGAAADSARGRLYDRTDPNLRAGGGGRGGAMTAERLLDLAKEAAKEGLYGGSVERAYEGLKRGFARDQFSDTWKRAEGELMKQQVPSDQILIQRDGYYARNGYLPPSYETALGSGVNSKTKKPFTQTELDEINRAYPRSNVEDFLPKGFKPYEPLRKEDKKAVPGASASTRVPSEAERLDGIIQRDPQLRTQEARDAARRMEELRRQDMEASAARERQRMLDAGRASARTAIPSTPQ